MPRNHKGTKIHKIKIMSGKLFSEILCFRVFVANNDFSEYAKFWSFQLFANCNLNCILLLIIQFWKGNSYK